MKPEAGGVAEGLRALLIEQGVSDVGYACVPEGDALASSGLPYLVSLAVKLSDAVVDEIDGAPTETYFNHYRSVNAFLDQMLLRAGLYLDRRGFRYLTVAASQSINSVGWSYMGRYSHKKAACLAGMGDVGVNSLFLHHEYGTRVRLGTLFTDCPVCLEPPPSRSALCSGCGKCVRACPAGAILGGAWREGVEREEIFNPEACSQHMKRAYQHIGRGAVCGVCMAICSAARGTRKMEELR